MIISRLILKNWKNFQKADIRLSNRVFVVGANASGKSNLLDAIRFLRDIVKQSGGLQFAVVQERGGVSKIRCLSARRDNEVSIEVHLAETSEMDEPLWKYRLSFKHAGGGFQKNQAKITEEKVWSREEDKWILDRTPDSLGEDDETLQFTHLQQVTANGNFRRLYHFFQETQYLHIVPQLVREADFYVLSAKKEDYYGRNLLERMAKTPPKTREAYMRRINGVLQIAVPQLKELKFIQDVADKGIPHLEAVYTHWRGRGAKQREAQFSDGTLRLIGLMWALLDGNETILMEEPELYLHTAIVKLLPEFIARLQKKKDKTRQVIITSHSYDLLSGEGIGANEVIILETTPEGGIVKRVDDSQELMHYLNAGFSMAEAVIPKTAPRSIENILELKMAN